MRKTLSLACAALALAGASLASPAAAADLTVVPPECEGGQILTGYDGSLRTTKDWYGLYNQRPNNNNWRDGLVGHVPSDDNSGVWKWSKDGNRYLTPEHGGNNLRTVYWTWRDGQYRYVDYSGPEDLACK
ncbi:hypothetical protein ACFSJS_18705 [Streptomyces desertarenae]|uniref:Secreted protein n=1 Tax=Streptomyces desertarenae TaxID=2666184 RepID=A0ABW4PLT1_9ACTN